MTLSRMANSHRRQDPGKSRNCPPPASLGAMPALHNKQGFPIIASLSLKELLTSSGRCQPIAQGILANRHLLMEAK